MRIVFICGSLEPGCDGVGDYTRRLACELIRQGHQIGVIALKDPGISKIIKYIQDTNGGLLATLRIPAHLPEKIRFSSAKEWIDDYNPELLSLQFVPFSF